MRVVFMGTPEFSTGLLKEIVSRGHEVVAVYTQPPRPAGRGMEPRKSPVHVLAESLGLPVFTPRGLRGAEETAAFKALKADVAVVAAYGLILPRAILEAPRLGCLNLHGSILPRWRGAAPIQRAIMAGDSESGVDVMRMEEGLDTGPVALETRVPIGPDMTAGELHDALALAGAPLMANALEALERGELVFTPQSEAGVTYAQKIDKAEARIDWRRPAQRIAQSFARAGAFSRRLLRGGPWRRRRAREGFAHTGGGGRRRGGNGARRRGADRLRRGRAAPAARPARRQGADGLRRVFARPADRARRAAGRVNRSFSLP